MNKPYDHNGDNELLNELGLPTWEAENWVKTYIGKVVVSDDDEYPTWIKIWVECAPAQFYSFEIRTESGDIISIDTGSGGLSDYYPLALKVAEGMFIPKKIKNSTKK